MRDKLNEIRSRLESVFAKIETSSEQTIRGELSQIWTDAQPQFTGTDYYRIIHAAIKSIEACIGPRNSRDPRKRQNAREDIAKVRWLNISGPATSSE